MSDTIEFLPKNVKSQSIRDYLRVLRASAKICVKVLAFGEPARSHRCQAPSDTNPMIGTERDRGAPMHRPPIYFVAASVT